MNTLEVSQVEFLSISCVKSLYKFG